MYINKRKVTVTLEKDKILEIICTIAGTSTLDKVSKKTNSVANSDVYSYTAPPFANHIRFFQPTNLVR